MRHNGQLLLALCRRTGTRYNEGVAYSEQIMTFSIETEQETDGRWLAEVEVLPGVMAYGTTKTDAVAKVQALALRVLADRLDHGEAVPELLSVSFQAA
jgi:predicted RNase H-like HicB family nuclease